MIIVAPTALYATILPTGPTDSTSITWTISSNNPPRPTIVVSLLPYSVEIKPLPSKTFNPAKRQDGVGEFVFNVNYSNRSEVGIGNKTFEYGEFLDFDLTTTIEELITLGVPNVIDLQQNTNYLDVEELGLTDEELADLEVSTRTMMNDLILALNTQKADANKIAVEIMNTQKLLNETLKVLNAAKVVYGATDSIVAKMEDRQAELEATRDEQLASLNIIYAEMNAQYNDLIKVKEMVK